MLLFPRSPSAPVNRKALAADLQAQLHGEVRFDDGSRALYATDSSNYRQVPIGVVLPKRVEDIIRTVEICRRYGAPLLSRGGGTSLAGQCCNDAVVMDMSKYYHRLLELDPGRKLARVEPGLVLDDLRKAAEKHHLTFGPDPSTHDHCTLGGMIGNNACGMHAQMAGRTAENVISLDVLTYDGLRLTVGRTSEAELESIIREGGRRGEIFTKLKFFRDRYADQIRARFPKIPRLISGYGLDHLLPENGFDVAKALVGTESTCVTVLEATLRLVDSPPARVLVVLGYPDIFTAADHLHEVNAYEPIALEGLDDVLVGDMGKKGMRTHDLKLLPPGQGWLVVQFGGETKEEADEKARGFMADLKRKPNPPSMKLYDNKEEEEHIWKVRESGLGATARIPGEKDTWEGWEDSAVHPDKMGVYLREFRKLLERYHYKGALYGHFGQGCLHTRINFDLETADGIQTYRAFVEEAADLVASLGGSFSGEHGDGQSRGELLPKLFGPELVRAFEEFKAIWDPEWKMNPGKKVRPYRLDENLRLGTHYNPADLKTHFKFIRDSGSFARATTRCVGVGTCRRENSGTMCPSYMVTREEMHSTRGRAHLLFEMLEGDPLKRLWREESVKEGLDLCFACKGCKSECPMNVDMATYKAEFLSHYYRRRVRPVTAYTMGLIYWWARLASHAPRIANFFTQTPGIRDLVKKLGGIASDRRIPAFAPETFKRWFRFRPVVNAGRPKVLLWADTFNNHFFPQTAMSAVHVLEAAGYQVIVPKASLCCGRPLYDYGMLNLAQRLLHGILYELAPEIEAGIPIVGLEPSCLSVFRDELIDLFPHEENARRLNQQCFSLSEFLMKKTQNYAVPQLKRKALVHGHCHHKSVLGMDADKTLMSRMGLEFEMADSGCCGMAGAFGYEARHYNVSVAAGERVLLPAVRSRPEDALIITDGFSCREQVIQLTNRRTFHLAEVVELALLDQKVIQLPLYEEQIRRRSATPRKD